MMKGFHTGEGYMGLVDGRYVLFASESDYYDYMDELDCPHYFDNLPLYAISIAFLYEYRSYFTLRSFPPHKPWKPA